MPVSLAVSGDVSIYDMDVRYSFGMAEKAPDEDVLRFSVNFVLGSDLEERVAVGSIGSDLFNLRLESYKFRGIELAQTGPPGYLAGDPEIGRFGRFPNVFVKCLRDAMLIMGLSTLIGVHVTDASGL
jgi:hypothetical protein